MACHWRAKYRARIFSTIVLLSSISLLLLAAGRCHCNTDAPQKPKPRPPPPSPPSLSSQTRTKPKSAPLAVNNLQPLLNVALASAPNSAAAAAAAAAAASESKLGAKSEHHSVKQVGQQQRAPPVADSSQDEPISKLDYSTLNDEILRKRSANFVYFNANFNQCRHCSRFYNTWRELALDIRWWRQVIRLFTINCSDEDNIDVCQKAGVTQFPQVRFYWTMSNSLSQDGQRLRILGKSVHALRHLIVDKVMDSYMEHNRLLAQRAQQRATAASSPLAGLTALNPGSAISSPFTALMPLVSQFFAGSKPAPSPTQAGPTSSSPLSAISGLFGMLMGRSNGAGGSGTNNGASSGLSIASLVSNFGGLQGIIDALMSVVSWRRSLTIQPLPRNWPELDPIEVNDTQRLLDMLPLDANKGIGALLVMETPEFLYTGLEVMLDLNPYSNQTYIARVRDERSLLTKNLTKRDDVQAPALIYITELREARLVMAAPKYTNDEDLRRAFVRAYERKHIKHSVKRVWSTGATGLNQMMARANDSSEDEEILNRMNDVHMNDLFNTIRASLTDQVFRHPDLSDDQYNALVKYVYALINYFPFKSDNLLNFFKRLHAWLQNQVSPIDMNEYKRQLHDIDESLGRREWFACKSLSSVNAVPSSSRRSGLLFENPAQLGKVVSNITRLFRANQQKVGQLKDLIGMLTSRSSTPVMLSNLSPSGAGSSSSNNISLRDQNSKFGSSSTSSTTTKRPSGGTKSPSSKDNKSEKDGDMPSSFEKLIKNVTNGSLGSDSSILKLISTALTGSDSSSSSSSSSGSSKSVGKSKFAREFSCGLWKLAHVMVVNEYLLDSPRKDVKHIVMYSLYQYMLNFYACATCGNRVSDLSGEFRLNLNEHLVEQGDSVMLLWKIHNRVNKRLEVEVRPGSPPKQQFPSEPLCAKCRSGKQQGGDLFSTPNWSEKNVFGFLVHHYRPQNIIAASSTDSSSSSARASARLLLSSNRPSLGLHFTANSHFCSIFWPLMLPLLSSYLLNLLVFNNHQCRP